MASASALPPWPRASPVVVEHQAESKRPAATRDTRRSAGGPVRYDLHAPKNAAHARVCSAGFQQLERGLVGLLAGPRQRAAGSKEEDSALSRPATARGRVLRQSLRRNTAVGD